MANKLRRTTKKTYQDYKGQEQAGAVRKAKKSYQAASKAAASGNSKGKITPKEKKAISYGAKAARSVTTAGEAHGYRKTLKRKARKS